MNSTDFKMSKNLPVQEIILRPDTMSSEISGMKIEFSPAEFALYWLFSIRRKNRLAPLRGREFLLEEFKAFSVSTLSSVFPEILKHDRFQSRNEDDMEDIVSSISEKIAALIPDEEKRDFFMPSTARGIYGISIPPENIDCPRNY